MKITKRLSKIKKIYKLKYNEKIKTVRVKVENNI
jgi:hypothetical protein